VKVPKAEGESTRCALVEAELIDNRLKIRSDESCVYLPVIESLSADMISKIDSSLTLTECDFMENERVKSIEDIIGFAPSFETIGDIAVVAEDYEKKVGEAIMAVHKNVKTVIVPTTSVSGEFRVREFKVLCGENRTTTSYKENGLTYEMDLAKVYFSPRLSTERKRVAGLVNDSELVLDMFCGVGPFAIPVAKRAMYVVAVDKNPYAVEYLKRNLELNHITNVEAVNMDARDIDVQQPVDRIIMNLPHTSFDFLDVAFRCIVTGGIIHYYDIKPESEIFEGIIKKIQNKATECGCLIEIVDKRIVRSYSPHEYNVVLDIRVVGKDER
jgi:tRNA (guanine37-N1)-methyltransferase